MAKYVRISISSKEGESFAGGKNREAISIGSGTGLRDEESGSSSQVVEVGTSEADDTNRENTLLVLGRERVNYLEHRKQRTQRGFFDSIGRGPSREGLAYDPATVYSASYGHDQQFTALRAEEAKRFFKTIPGLHRTTTVEEHTSAYERRLKTTAQAGLVSVGRRARYCAARRRGEYLRTSAADRH